MRKTFISLLLIGMAYSQQQIDIPWPTLADSDWPMIKHDPQFTGRSPFRGPQTPTVIWTIDMPYGIFSGPVLGKDNNLYFGSYYVFGDYFYSYSPDGKFIWKYQTGSGRATQSGILIDSSNTIYFGSRDSNFYALNSDGTFKWKYKTSAPIFQEVMPNIDLQGNIFITNSRGELYSIKPNGTLNWSVSYENGFGSGSPVFSPDGNTIYIAGKDSNLFALNLDSSLKWKFSCGQIMRAPMVDSDGNIYALASNYLYSISDTGNMNWNYFLFGSPIAIPTIDKDGNTYTIAWDTTCCPYYPALISLGYDGAFKWKYIFDEVEGDHFEQPLICDIEGTVYVGSTFGHNYYAISSDGKLKWKLPLIPEWQQVDNTGAISKDGTLYLGVHHVSINNVQIKTLIAIKDTSTVSVNENCSKIDGYSISQNYPNPFNSSTSINYQIKEKGFVSLKVFDMLGKEVANLVNETQDEGQYSVIFDASNLPSGVYIYSLRVNDFVQNNKMTLLK